MVLAKHGKWSPLPYEGRRRPKGFPWETMVLKCRGCHRECINATKILSVRRHAETASAFHTLRQNAHLIIEELRMKLVTIR